MTNTVNTLKRCLAIVFALCMTNCLRAQIVEPGSTHDQH